MHVDVSNKQIIVFVTTCIGLQCQINAYYNKSNAIMFQNNTQSTIKHEMHQRD